MELNVIRHAAWIFPLLLALGGCANRSAITLSVPGPTTVVSGDKVAVIESVSDQRQFGQGGSATQSLHGRDKSVAIGNVSLASPQTVEGISRQLVANGLQQHGYRLVNPQDAPSDALRVQVAIEEFWSSLNQGFWTMDMESRVRLALQFAGASTKHIEISADGKKSAPSDRGGNYQEAYDRVFEDYLQKQDAALSQAGL